MFFSKEKYMGRRAALCAVSRKGIKREALLKALKDGPKRFGELKRAAGFSDYGVYKALKDLEAAKLVQRLEDGGYALTEDGRRLAEEIEVGELARELARKLGPEAVKSRLLAAESGGAPAKDAGEGKAPLDISLLVELVKSIVEWERAREGGSK